jgi:hypothetical protein
MNFKIEKNEKEYDFVYSSYQIDGGRTKPKPITVHKWLCADLPEDKNDVFFMVDHSDVNPKSIEDMLPVLKEQATKLI